jgi:hypothetical protein
MQIGYDPDGRPYVAKYEVGDLVRLRLDETGDGAMGKIGDWGSILSVERGVGARLNIQVAGYSEGKHSMLQRLMGIPKSIVAPCDRNGVPISLPERLGLRDVEAGFSRRIGNPR